MMRGQASAAVQARIDAQQDYDALVYGIRTAQLPTKGIMANREAMIARSSGCAARQWRAATDVASRLLGKQSDGSTLQLKDAKKLAADELKAAKDAVKELGTRRQLRLALAADDSELALAEAA